MPPNCKDLSEEEIALRNGLKQFKQAQKLLNDLREELAAKMTKPEVPVKAPRSTEKAKEKAMKLLKSGAISFDSSVERHVFKRKVKDLDVSESEALQESNKAKKSNLYDNFVAGDRINPSRSSPVQRHQSIPFSENHRDSIGSRPSYSRNFSQSEFESGDDRRSKSISTLYVSFSDINESNVREIFEPYGPILNVRIDDKKGYGFVTLKSHEMAEKALQLDRSCFNNVRLRVNYARRQHHVRECNFEETADRQHSRGASGGPSFNRSQRRSRSRSPPTRSDSSSLPPTSNRNLISYSDLHMFHRFVFGKRNPLSYLLSGFRPVSTNTESGAVDLYVGANRTKFYRTLGIFCLIQGAVWFAFGQYLFRRRKEKLTLEMMKADLNHINVLIANKLESWTPETLKKIIFRNRKTLSGLPQVNKEEINPEPLGQPVETIEAKVEEKDMQSELKQFSNKVRETFGILEDKDGETQDEGIETRQIIPYICFIMSAFTFFIGGFIPCRVIRRIYFSIKSSANTAVVLPENLDPVVRVNTYGWFGVFPSRGKHFTIPISSMRVTAGYQEDQKFMNLIIGRHPFIFYLERPQAQFLLPEFFEHLTSTANEKAKK
nr:negative elongation factor e [Hymenolepis microstoma]CUU98236.1 negative elongation factor e [Hymenolepis microstoma]